MLGGSVCNGSVVFITPSNWQWLYFYSFYGIVRPLRCAFHTMGDVANGDPCSTAFQVIIIKGPVVISSVIGGFRQVWLLPPVTCTNGPDIVELSGRWPINHHVFRAVEWTSWGSFLMSGFCVCVWYDSQLWLPSVVRVVTKGRRRLLHFAESDYRFWTGDFHKATLSVCWWGSRNWRR